MKNSQKDLIRRMQKQDALGISRKKREYLHIGRRLYRTVKIAFAVLIPVMFFLYSPLLILVVLAYFVTVCIFNANAEKEMNENYRRDCHVKMPRYDLIVAGIVLGVTIVGIVLSEILSKSAGGMLGSFSDDELEDFIGSGKFPGGMSGTWFKVREILTDLGSLMTGERSLFFSFRIGMQPPPGGFGGGRGDARYLFERSAALLRLFHAVFRAQQHLRVCGRGFGAFVAAQREEGVSHRRFGTGPQPQQTAFRARRAPFRRARHGGDQKGTGYAPEDLRR